jgi:hypothetical protein
MEMKMENNLFWRAEMLIKRTGLFNDYNVVVVGVLTTKFGSVMHFTVTKSLEYSAIEARAIGFNNAGAIVFNHIIDAF